MAHESSGYQQALRELRAPTSGETKSQGQQDISQNQHQVTLLDDSRAEITPPVDATLSGTKSEIPQILTKIVASTDDGGAKKKRGRPKKLILDPETNQFIDSSHEHYKRLNKLLKERSATVKPSSLDSEVGKFIQKGTNFGSLDDQAVKQLLEQKDRRGRPRKFPIEQTGVTIKGIRVNGTLKVRKKSSTSTSPSPDQGIKKKRGRPKRDQSALS